MNDNLFNDIYLCYTYSNTNKYNCLKFSSWYNADKYSHLLIGSKTTLIPICKFIPTPFVNDILHYKLSKLLVHTTIIE
jgi:hypothetical protein